MAALRLAIAGAAGRMGRELIRAAAAASDIALTGATARSGSAALGVEAGALVGVDAPGAVITDDAAAAAAAADGWVDFTTPDATLAALDALSSSPVRFAIVGTTGFGPFHDEKLAAAARRFALVRSGNFSLGVNLAAGLVRQAAARLGPDWDIEIVEAHHRHKIDAPSGTALMLGEAAADGRGERLADRRIAPRDGRVGPRPEGGIGFAVIRAGGIVGEHEAVFASENEIVRISHSALDRAIFARGALAAARWAADKAPGLYSMQDVLGL